MSNDVPNNAYDWAKANLRQPTTYEARRLRVGDVIEVFYLDEKLPSLEVVVEAGDDVRDIFDVKTIPESKWNSKSSDTFASRVNSEYWRLVGTLKFVVDKKV